jgi:hypothetical protein
LANCGLTSGESSLGTSGARPHRPRPDPPATSRRPLNITPGATNAIESTDLAATADKPSLADHRKVQANNRRALLD